MVLLRLAGVYDDRGHNAFLSQQIARIYERQMLGHLYSGDVRRGQAFVHLADVGTALQLLIEKRKELPNELPLLVGEPETLSYDEIQRTVGRLLHGEHWNTREMPKPWAKAGAWVETEILQEEPFIRPWMVDFADDHYELDISRARSLLGWEPTHTLQTTLPVMIDALKADPVAWYRDNKLNSALVAGQAAARAPNEQDANERHVSAEQLLAKRRMLKEHEQMMLDEHRQTLWAHFANIGLGCWLATSPLVFGLFDSGSFSEAVLRVTADRGLPPPEWRNWALGLSDVSAGALIILFGVLSLSRRSSWAQWANTIVGLWLLFAPLLFWSPGAAAYANDTLVGALVITFAVLVPMMPGMSMEGMMGGPDTPPGWTYCPSTWAQRLPIIVMGAIGFLIARYLAAYQMGHIDSVWDPFFAGPGGHNGTETIITSAMSKAWLIPDGGLGAVAYMLEILMGAMGDKRRWRTMPWMVTFFGILVVPLGVVSIYFIIIQPIVIGTWCALCLLAALAMIIMIPFSLDELVAMGQFLLWSRRRSKSLLRIFFMGGALEGGKEDKAIDLESVRSTVTAMTSGMTMPWTLVVSVILGVWLMFTRLTFGTVPPMADSDHLVGALIVTTAVIAMAEVARPLRFINVMFGGWLVFAPWFLKGGSSVAMWADVAIGVALIGLSLPRGTRSRQHYAGWDRLVV